MYLCSPKNSLLKYKKLKELIGIWQNDLELDEIFA